MFHASVHVVPFQRRRKFGSDVIVFQEFHLRFGHGSTDEFRFALRHMQKKKKKKPLVHVSRTKPKDYHFVLIEYFHYNRWRMFFNVFLRPVQYYLVDDQ